jgi:pyruvate formate lyase activating enzyme
MHEARHYKKLDDRAVLCGLCAQHCRIGSGQYGKCGVRKNIDGTLFTTVYGLLAAANADPIEKKPLYHFCPGQSAFSLATIGCNFRCTFCQNWNLSQASKGPGRSTDGGHAPSGDVAAGDLVRMALDEGCRIVAYTYSEPTIFYEWAYDVARDATQHGLYNVFVTNGYIAAEPLREIEPYLHGANVDLKAFDDHTYIDIMGARGLQPVLDTLKLMKKLDIWVEVTTLLVPTRNDSDGIIRDIARFISDELGPETPWHISRFHPDYKDTDLPPTPINSLRRAYTIGREAGLRYVYVGNVHASALGIDTGSTQCHVCGEMLIERSGYQVVCNRLTKGAGCPSCGTEVAGVGMN